MWGQSPREILIRQAERGDRQPDLHRPIGPNGPPDVLSEGQFSAESSGNQDASADLDAGMWGERDIGGSVRTPTAMHDFEALRQELTRLDRTRTETSDRTTPKASSFRGSRSRTKSRHTLRSEPEKDIDSPTTGTTNEEDDFHLDQFMKEGHFEPRTEEGRSGKKLGVIFKNLTVKGVGSKTAFVRTLPEAVLGTFGPDLYRNLCKAFPALKVNKHVETRDLLRDFTGVVRGGEMMLVLGRPGSGCSTFLKAIANSRGSYASVEGKVLYGGITAEEQRKRYRGEVVYNPEQDVHLPSLNVFKTLQFSLLNKTRRHHREDINTIIDALLRMFAIKHTEQTLVGNEYVRGISGGERKRVSIAETLATKSTVTCWDNSTRGLDASTALDYARSLRIMTDVSDRTTITTLYQAGEEIYELMDKVLVIEDGRMIFQGPADEGRQYFIDLGFYASDRQTTADFLTSIGDANERQFREGMRAQCPKTPAELETAFRNSENYKRVLADVAEYEEYLDHSGYKDAENLRISVGQQKSKTVQKKSSYTVSFWRQVLACTKREFWLIWGDKPSFYTKYFIIASVGLIVGSLFYKQPSDTSGAFSRGGTAFFSILFLGWLALVELIKAVSGRAVIARHGEYAFYRPSAVIVARVITDFPMILAQVIPFGVIMYFMTDLALEPAKFFIYLLLIYTTTFSLTALYRMFAALSPNIDDAVRFAGISFNLLIIYTGYVIPKPQLLSQKIWFGWIYYINPITYAFEAVLANEFSGRVLPCAPEMLVPQGPNVRPGFQGCAFSGASIDSTTVSGDAYLQTSFNYSHDNLWRNFGVLIAFTVLYVVVTMIATETITFTEDGGGALVYKKSKHAKLQAQAATKPKDEESGESDGSPQSNALSRLKSQDEALEQLSRSDRMFTWSGLSYTVPVPGGEKKLLDNVAGYAKPGLMVALVGASGAGKTTLLNTLSQRQTTGVVTGDMLVDGHPIPADFQRSTGYVEQMDLHDTTATVREALEFSALLRQERGVPRNEKLEYVDKVVDLLELHEIQDTIISSLGVEQKKRLTIAVELAAKPGLLLFLDEPTSGLDSQSAFSIIRFLKKLSAAGQAIVCTIHQPSSMLIQQFDTILTLNPGGHTVYFGPVGSQGSAVVKYFADRDVHCPANKNVAEFILETVTKGGRRQDGKRIDWSKEWNDSAENQQVHAEIKRICEERGKVTEPEKSSVYTFAAPVWTQTTLLTQRMFRQQWREPSYVYGRLFVSVVIGIFNGFTFWQLGNTVGDMQNRMFTSFMIVLIPPTIVNAVVPKFFQNLALWEAREHPSRTYGWIAYCTASVVTEIPSAIASATLYWALWYWATGLPTDASTAGYVYLMCILFFIFISSWGQWICAFAPSFTVISNVLPFFFVMFGLFNGIIQPYSELNVFWRSWLYWLIPSQYWISGVMAATLSKVQVRCAPSEAAYFNPPPGQTCLEYAGAYVKELGMGYLTNPQATRECGFCQYSSGIEYMNVLNVRPEDKWRDFGIFLMFCVSNWVLVYFFVWTVRVKGWTFGFGSVARGVDRALKTMQRK